MGALTILSLLTSVGLYNNAKAGLPQIGYFMYLDFFCLLVSIGTVCAIFEFLFVHWSLRQKNWAASEKDDASAKMFAARAETLESYFRRGFPVYILFTLIFMIVPLAH